MCVRPRSFDKGGAHLFSSHFHTAFAAHFCRALGKKPTNVMPNCTVDRKWLEFWVDANMKSYLPLGILQAIGAAALFGGSTPFAKLLLSGLSPGLLAGLLYLGSGLGLLLLRLTYEH